MSKTCPALLAVLILLNASLHATTYWVAPPPTGNDSNSGTSSNAPLASPVNLVMYSNLVAGDTIFVRGGTYALSAQVRPGNKNGTAGNPIKLWAYPGELPVFDFASMGGGNKALDLRRNYWHVKGIEVKNAPDSGILVAGIGNIIEGCVIHDCGNDGFIFGSTSARATNSLILNCDSYRNCGGGDGNNGDGFGAKAGCGSGNVFRGCRAWNNADDGWDYYDTAAVSTVMQNCWSFWNGYNVFGYGGTWNGNGNGFKLGGEGTAAEHVLTNCVAFGNRSKGFDHNNGNAGQTMVNCTSYSNANPNFSFYETPSAGTLLHNVFINNVSYYGTLTNLAANSVMISNSWQIATVNAADFASLDVTLALAPRNADYSLPTNGLFRLAAGSDLIDRGANVGLPFNGSAPDLGAFEFSAAAPPQGPISFNASHFTNGGFSVRVAGLTSHGPVVLHASSNLTSWTPVLTNPATTGATQFVDPITNRAVRFYRAEEK